jgi:short-subunit dehydrogenase
MPFPETVYRKSTSILITGASSGIGAALAVRLARYGSKLALLARRSEQLAEVAEQVRSAGGTPLIVVSDVTNPTSVAEAHAQIVASQGAVEIAFLNAGLGGATSLARFSSRSVRQLFEVNVFGVANWLEVLLPSMIEAQRGIIAGTSSLAATRGMPDASAYSASKAALSNLLESLRLDAPRHGLQITTIEPGFVRSPMTEKNTFPMPYLMDAEAAAQLIADRVAEGRTMIRFPWQIATVMNALRILPGPLYCQVGKRMRGKK